MLEHSHDEWQAAFWSTLALEMLARAALAKVSPALLADSTNWHHIYYALGHEPNAQKYTPKSITITEVLVRLRDIVPGFTTELERFCIAHTGNRNAELHSGATPFDGVPSSSWRPMFYQASAALLQSMKLGLEDLVSEEEAEIANKEIAAAVDATAKAAVGQVKAYLTVWQGKSEGERKKLTKQAEAWATRHVGHRVNCPACQCDALVVGEPIAAPKKTIDDDEITEIQQYLPSQFECVACGLKISGLSQLGAVGLGDAYKKKTVYSAAEFYAPEDHYPEYEEDNNEP